MSLDRARAVRPGEEIDATRLARYLRLDAPPRIEQFPRGFSNLTYLLRDGERELVLRRPPAGSTVKSAHDMSREYEILRRLIEVYPKVPRPIAYCDDPEVIGAPFYVMERVRGVILRDRLPEHVVLGPEVMRGISEAAIDNLADIHAVDYAAVGLDLLARPQGYVARQVSGWTQRYQKARTDDIAALDLVAQWLAERAPSEAGACLIHNDYKYDNLVLAPDNLSDIRAVLDWEMATVGDPLLDLGTTLGYWIEASDPPAMQGLRLGLTTLPGNLTRAEVVQRYAKRSRREVRDAVFYYVYGLFKIAGIAQQIYVRYKQGVTKDERFAGLIGAIRVIGEHALECAVRGRV